MALCLPLRLNISNSTFLPSRGQLIHDQDFGSCVSCACYLHQPIPSPSTHHTHTHTHTHTCTHTEVCGLRLQSCQNTGCLDHPCKGDSRTHHIYMSLCICNKAITNLIAISLQRHLLVAKACLRGRTLNIAAGQGHRGWTSFRISPEGSSPWPP